MNKVLLYSLVTFTLLASMGLGVVIGYFSRSTSNDDDSPYKGNDVGEVTKEAMDSVSADSIRNYLQELSSQPHLAGLQRDDELASWIMQEWLDVGLDHAELAPYDLYLSFPDRDNPNKVHLLDASQTVNFTSRHQEVELRPGDAHPDFVDAFNAYAPAGEAEGVLVYVNYASVEDLAYLESVGISLVGKIAIARYGGVFRGNKLDNVERSGAIGLIIFSDPADVAPSGVDPEDVYPNTIFLPPTGVQRGTVFVDNGDPLTPFWPSVPNAYRISRAESVLPVIPCQPISYEDAKVLLEKMGGLESPQAWKGGISGVDYRLGGEMLPEFQDWKVRLSVHNYEETVSSSNVIGYVVGETEPDRYVYLSNHRDAWGYGAMDPSSGTANLMEVARVLGEMRRTGWRPRRTIVLCSWAAEEYGLEGSEEWVQEKIDKIMDRSVALLNTDMCVKGSVPVVSSSSSVRELMLEGLRSVAHWENPEASVYDVWYDYHNEGADDLTDPPVSLLDSGSDQANFMFYAGVPSVDFNFGVDKKAHGVSGYPMYHTAYETFFLVDVLVDPGLVIHKTCSQISLHFLLNLAESQILPYNLRHVALDMEEAVGEMLVEGGVAEILTQHGVTLDYLVEAVNHFKNVVEEYSLYVESLTEDSDPFVVKMVNDQMMLLERVFLLPQGLPLGRIKSRHAVFSPALHDQYGAAAFAGIGDLLYGIEGLAGEVLRVREEELKRHVSDLMIVVRNAASFLQPLYKI